MSRGFVKEEDQEEAPFIPPRAALPPTETNYVTEKGIQLLEEEKADLENQKRLANQQENETERRRTNMELDGKLRLLNERIASARIINISDQPKDEVRFGARVRYSLDGREFTITIVGVDEANVKEGKVAFVAPLIRAMSGKKEGEEFAFDMGGRERVLKVLSIEYQIEGNKKG